MRWLGQQRAPAGMTISWEMKILCRTSTGTTTSFGPGLLHRQHEEWPLVVQGNGRVTEGGLNGACCEGWRTFSSGCCSDVLLFFLSSFLRRIESNMWRHLLHKESVSHGVLPVGLYRRDLYFLWIGYLSFWRVLLWQLKQPYDLGPQLFERGI